MRLGPLTEAGLGAVPEAGSFFELTLGVGRALGRWVRIERLGIERLPIGSDPRRRSSPSGARRGAGLGSARLPRAGRSDFPEEREHVVRVLLLLREDLL